MSDVAWRRFDGPPVIDAKVAETEAALGVTFPSPLREIFRQGDGGRPEKTAIVAQTDEGEAVVDALSQILTVNDDRLLRCREVLLEHAEDQGIDPGALRWIIPVADNGDGWICLDYREDSLRATPSVVGYSLSGVAEADSLGLYPIAKDFDSLLRMLRA